MKLTPIGYLPEDWDYCQLRDNLDLLTDYDANGSFADMANNVHTEIGSGYAWYVRATDLEQKTPLSEVRYTDKSSYEFLKKSSLFGGEVLVAKRGEIGKVYYFEKPQNLRATLAPNLYLLKLKKTIHSHWLYYFFVSPRGQELLKSINASTSLGAIYKEDVKNLHIPLPNLDEQKRIAEALTAVDNMIATLDEAIAKKRQIKEGLMQQLLTGKTRLPGFTGEWKETRLGDIFDFYKGTGLSKADIDSTGNNQCILYGEIFTKYNIAVKGEISRTASCVGTPSVKGDILMPGSTTTVGIDLVKAVFVDTDSILLGGDIIILRKKEQVDSAFFAMLISNISRNVVTEKAQGTTIIHLHGKDLTDIRYLVPESEQEQKGISTVVSKVDAVIEELNYKKNKLILLKQGMMQELLTGKTRLI